MAKPDKKKPTDAGSALAPAPPVATPPAALDRVVEGDGVEKELLYAGHVGPGETLSVTASGDGTGMQLPDADSSTYGPDAKLLEPPEADELAAKAQASLDAATPEERAVIAEAGAHVVLEHSDTPPPPCPKCTYERPCSIECWVKAGCNPDEYEAEMARIDAKAKPALVHLPPAPAPPANGKRRYRVWPHGELHRNNVVYKAGDPIDLTEAEASTIPCIQLAE